MSTSTERVDTGRVTYPGRGVSDVAHRHVRRQVEGQVHGIQERDGGAFKFRKGYDQNGRAEKRRRSCRNPPRECPTTVTFLVGYVESASSTAATTPGADLRRTVGKWSRKIKHKRTYLPWVPAKPWWTITDCWMPGNKVESRGTCLMSRSVMTGSLRQCFL